jgi:quinol monooxygenase YgiN
MSHKVIVAIFKPKIGLIDELHRRLLEGAKLSLNEPGVIKYTVNFNQEENYFLNIEVYMSNEAFKEHLEKDYVKNFINDFPNLLSEDLTLFETSPKIYTDSIKGNL